MKNRVYSVFLTGVMLSFLSLTFVNEGFAQEEVIVEEEIIEVEGAIEGDSLGVAAEMEEIPVVTEYIPLFTEQVIETRLKSLQKDIALSYNPVVKGFIDYFTIKNRKYALVMERRKNLYFPIFEEALKRHSMPDELKYLAIVESGLNPRAISRVGAAGLWQFMPLTGKEYKLYQDDYIDERLDPFRSTDAACRYLKESYKVLGDWQLAIASYNCGIGNVRRAIRKSGYKDSFWEVYKHLPKETRAYVPQFVALTYVMNHLEDHNIIADSIEYPIQFDTLTVSNQKMNLEVLCSQLNICPEEFLKLNPAIKKHIIPANTTYTIRIPSDKSELLVSNRNAILDSCKGAYVVFDTTNINESLNVALEALNMTHKLKAATASYNSTNKRKVVYVVRRGDVLGKISDRFNVSVADVKRWNQIKSNNIRIGQKLTIYTKSAYASTSTVSKASPARQTSNGNVSSSTKKVLHHYVQPGDTLWTISQKYDGVTVEKIKRLNKLKGNSIKPGQKLILG